MSLTDLLVAAERREIPPRAVAVTFDDGYAGVHRHAFPILRELCIPATVYLATGVIGGGPMWNDRIEIAIRNTERPRCDLVPDFGELPLCTAEQRRSALERTLETLKRRRPAEREVLTVEVERKLGVPAADGPRMLDWDQIAEMHRAGIDFGAHTVTHPILGCVSPDEARREIHDSKRIIEDRLQTAVRHFAYPNGAAGDFDQTTAEIVRAAGFQSAVSTIFGRNTADSDRYALRRGGPWEEDPAVFGAKLWWYRWERGAGASGPAMMTHPRDACLAA
jgi:peptidoglycan/xylan/chitin deacetylase (PgdA/CDA1 family)